MDDLARLADRVRSIEDRLEVYHLISMHPVATDCADPRFWEERWTSDSHQDKLRHPDHEDGEITTRSALLDDVRSLDFVRQQASGLLHVPGLPHILITGDTAVATSYSQLVELDGGEVRLRQATVSRWELVRAEGGWQIKRRVMRNIGTRGSIELLRRGLDDAQIKA